MSIDAKLLSIKEQTIQLNRRNLKRIFECVDLCAQQGLPFRGHDESEQSKNKGTFLAIVEFGRKNCKEFDDWLNFHNLGLKDASLELLYLANCIELVNNVANFVEGSTNRHALFKELQEGEKIKMVLSFLSQTRSFTAIRKCYSFILEFFNVRII